MKNNRFARSKKFILPKVKDYLKSKPITPASAQSIITGKRPKSYVKKDIAAAAILSSISPKAYRLIRSRKWMQLPSRTTTKRWLKNFSIRDGLQPLLMDVVLSKYPEKEARETFIAFDEMAVKERWVYDKVL